MCHSHVLNSRDPKGIGNGQCFGWRSFHIRWSVQSNNLSTVRARIKQEDGYPGSPFSVSMRQGKKKGGGGHEKDDFNGFPIANPSPPYQTSRGTALKRATPLYCGFLWRALKIKMVTLLQKYQGELSTGCISETKLKKKKIKSQCVSPWTMEDTQFVRGFWVKSEAAWCRWPRLWRPLEGISSAVPNFTIRFRG